MKGPVRAAWALLLASCSYPMIESGGFTVYQVKTEEAFRVIRNRAALELSCSGSDLAVIVVNAQDGFPTEIGATGCGHKAVYIQASAGSGWALNSIDGHAK